ncbi:MAG: hydrogenase iron-sulfur subunit [Rubrivivax sp.]|nr:hydrogenase iron-sulfur subunit [Rubrivivax sp.]
MSSIGAGLESPGLKTWRSAERLFDAAFGPGLNPLRHLGAIGMLAFALLLGSGIVLYVLFDTSAQLAWRSVDRLDDLPLASGRWLRGLHRYSADLLVISLALHLLREWLHHHERGFRRFSWLTGVPLIPLAFAAAIVGFWLNWDALGQYSAIASAEWIDSLPGLASPLARNFLVSAQVSDRLFSLWVFVHIGVPLLMVFGLWFHVQRISRPAWMPPKRLLLGTVLMLSGLALLLPVRSHDPALLAEVPQALRLDWILLFIHPLVDLVGGPWVWLGVAGAALLLTGLPWLPSRRVSLPVAVVDAANCNGCQRCFADCPYAAITMRTHPNQRVGRLLAVVDAELCAGCGICAGACPSSTPFRSGETLVTGIDMPALPIQVLRQQLREGLQAARRNAPQAPGPVVVFRCARGADRVAAEGTLTFDLICAGQLPPSFVEYALRDGAGGVAVSACCDGACEFRFGERWTAQRLAGTREPHLRASVAAAHWRLVQTRPGDEALLAETIDRLRDHPASLARPSPSASSPAGNPTP